MSGILAVFIAVFQLIGLILFKFYGWVIIVAILGYQIWQNRRQKHWVEDVEMVLLKIDVPKDNEKKELSAEQMFASLHGILKSKEELHKEGAMQEHFSLEIASVGNQIRFYAWVPRHIKDFVEGQIYAHYPSVHIEEGANDYTRTEIGDRHILGTELLLAKTDVLPIKTFQSFEVDPLAGITAILGKLEQEGEEMWIQVLARPVDDSWQQKSDKFVSDMKTGKGKSIGDVFLELPLHLIQNLFTGIYSVPEGKKEEKKEEKKLSTGQQAMVKAAEEKSAKLGYEVKIRAIHLGQNETLARQRMQALVGSFKQFNTTNLNGFTTKGYHADQAFLDDYRARLFLDHGYILNIEELASLYHLPHKSVETPSMVWTSVKTAEPPFNLPSDRNVQSDGVSLFGVTNFRGQKVKFGIKRADRGRHLYIIGQTGTGKSFLLQLLALSDLYHNHGIAIIDPHGDFATDMLKYVPEHRLDDVIYMNPADMEFPIAFNPMEQTEGTYSKNHITSELVGVLKRLFESWGPRLEHILRFTILALLDYPDATMLMITRMLTEKEFRKKVVRQIQDPVVKNFWVNEFASWNDKFANEAVAPVLNKVGAFTANPLVRNIVGQPKSAFDLRRIMDEGKILVVNLSRGLVGEDNAAVLGALMVTKMQLAAMSRADIPMDARRPFYLYVDEFQNFATDSFAVILSEARKYGLNLTVANQYIAQMPETVKDAVFGNVGSLISFRVGATDATFLGKYFEPTFEPGDLIKLHNQDIFVTMSIDGEKSPAFSGHTLRMPEPENDQTEQIVELSRHRYAKPKTEVEDLVARASRDHGPDDEGGQSGHTEPAEQKPNTFLGQLKNPEQASGHKQHHASSHNDRREAHRPAEQRPSQVSEHRAVQTTPENDSSAHELSADEAVRIRR